MQMIYLRELKGFVSVDCNKTGTCAVHGPPVGGGGRDSAGDGAKSDLSRSPLAPFLFPDAAGAAFYLKAPCTSGFDPAQQGPVLG